MVQETKSILKHVLFAINNPVLDGIFLLVISSYIIQECFDNINLDLFKELNDKL